jgi:hypothetical protein
MLRAIRKFLLKERKFKRGPNALSPLPLALLRRQQTFDLRGSRKPRSNTMLECSHIYELIDIDTLDLIGIRHWEETAGRGDAKTARAVMLTYFADFHEIENQGAGGKGPQIAAHKNIGFDAMKAAFSNRIGWLMPASTQSPTLVKNRKTWSAP